MNEESYTKTRGIGNRASKNNQISRLSVVSNSKRDCEISIDTDDPKELRRNLLILAGMINERTRMMSEKIGRCDRLSQEVLAIGKQVSELMDLILAGHERLAMLTTPSEPWMDIVSRCDSCGMDCDNLVPDNDKLFCRECLGRPE